LYLTPRLSILGGAQAIFAERRFIDEFLTDPEGNQSNRQDFWGFNPKFGAIYEINRKTQAFVNFSRSWQPPSLDNLVDFTEGPNPALFHAVAAATRLDRRSWNSPRVFAVSMGVIALSRVGPRRIVRDQ
jgi:hypothetical protein